MKTATIKKYIQEVADEEFCVELSDEQNLKDCGLDSLSLVVLIASIEDKFGFRFDEDELQPESLATLDQLVALTERHI